MKTRLLLGLLALVLIGSAVHADSDQKTLIVAIGDSTTAGTPFFRSPLESPPDGSGDPEGAYAYWMMERRPQWQVLNYGIAGETTSQIRSRFSDALKQNPRYVIILAGVNDIYQGIPFSKAAENLMAMYREAEGRSILPIAATVLPFNNATPEQTKAIEALNTWIRKAADKMRIPIADLYVALDDPKNPGHLQDTPDGLHPGVGGYRKMALTLIDAIDPIEKTWR
jgi:lysophospholipase L1-like esterase